MDNYQHGKRLLDTGDIAAAEAFFQAGWTAGDLRCAYGLLAAAAMSGKSTRQPEQRLLGILGNIIENADAGDGDCCFILARCLETGSAMAQDIPRAMRYYTKAANLGNADAMFNLGCLYIAMGKGGRALAREYFGEAAAAGCIQAQAALDYMRQEDTAAE